MKEMQLPPVYCSSICRNAMSEACVTKCAVFRDASEFKLKKGFDLIDAPRFPIDAIDEMTNEEIRKIVTVYVYLLVDHMKGITDEPEFRPIRRNPNRSNGSSVPETLQSQGVLLDPAKPDTLHQDRKECENQEVRPDEVD